MKNDKQMILFHRLEHGKNPIKNQITNNSRDNYRKFANSDIFASKALNRSQDDRFTSFNTNNPYYNIFNPKFKEETAQSRRLKEFHNLSTVDTTNEQNKPSKSKDEPKLNVECMNPKEKKLNELYPNINKEVLKQCVENNKAKKFINSSQDNLNNTVKSKNTYYSNIFNDPDKEENVDRYSAVETKFSTAKKTFVEEDDLMAIKRKPASKLKSHFDWKSTNTELAFKDNSLGIYEANACKMKSRNYVSVAQRQRTVENFSPFKMKLNNLTSSFDNECLTMDRKQDSVTNDKEKARILEKIIEEKPKIVSHKLQKTFENVSSLHSPDFYKALETKSNNFQVETFLINDMSNLNNLGEFKSFFTKNGIHIYDIKERGIEKYNASTSLTFKVRKNVDKKCENEKFDNVIEQLSKTGIKIEKSIEKSQNNKLAATLMPSNIKWNNHHVERFIYNNNNLVQKNEQPRSSIPITEKLSKKFPSTDSRYKNNFANVRLKK